MVKGIKYFCADDIAKYLEKMGDSQPTDVQTTLDEAAAIFKGVNKSNKNKHLNDFLIDNE